MSPTKMVQRVVAGEKARAEGPQVHLSRCPGKCSGKAGGETLGRPQGMEKREQLLEVKLVRVVLSQSGT